PGAAAVHRDLRHDLIREHVAVAQVAGAEVRALRPVVAGDPLLVLPEARARADGLDRPAPAAAVARAVDRDGRAGAREDERDREPDAVAAVEGDRRVARARGQAAEEAARPRPARVTRHREADVARAAVEDAPDLEDGDDLLAEGGGIGLDLRLVLALRVGVRVAWSVAG